MNRPVVAIATGNDTAQNVKTALDLGPWIDDLDVHHKSALVKVNLTGGSPHRIGETTTLETADAVVTFFQSIGYSVTVCEGSSGIYSAPTNFETSGYQGHFERLGIPCVDISRASSRMIHLPHARCHVPIPNLALDSGLIVSVPVPKRHFVTTITCTLKNVGVGILAKSSKMRYHGVLDQLIPDVNAIFKQQIIVVDARWALAETGPFNGTPVKLDSVIVGSDPVAVDSTCCRIMGLDPLSVGHIRNAWKYSVGQVHPELRGCSIKVVKKAFETYARVG